MNITLEVATLDQMELVANLMEKYEYEFSQYSKSILGEDGLYGCIEWIDVYWEDENCWPYIIRVDGRIAGFALVGNFEIGDYELDFIVDEFFLIYDYRNQGVGQFVVNYLLDRHKGRWGLVYTPRNLPASNFWPKVIGEYTGGKYQLIENEPTEVYDDGTLGTVILFES
jgi:predicted acetyltransferase